MKYTPAFNFQGTRFVVASRDWIANDKIEADKMGTATLFVEGILFGFQRDKENPIQQIPEDDTEGKLTADLSKLKGKDLGELPIYINIKEKHHARK